MARWPHETFEIVPSTDETTITLQPTEGGKQPVVIIDQADLPGNTSGDERGSYDGAGIAEIMNVIDIIQSHGIASCVAGVGALKYYGAWRFRHVRMRFSRWLTALTQTF